jgi:hypothetical protein
MQPTSAVTPISTWVLANVRDGDLRYAFFERSGMALSDGATVEQADKAAFREVFGKDWHLNYDT